MSRSPSESHEYSSLATLTRSPSVMTDITDEWASLAQSEEHEVEAALLSASITDEQLSVLAGTREFESVKFLQCAVDSEFVPLSCLGERLPALEQLKLNGSSLPSLRYLGTSMTQLRVLWLCRCAAAGAGQPWRAAAAAGAVPRVQRHLAALASDRGRRAPGPRPRGQLGYAPTTRLAIKSQDGAPNDFKTLRVSL